MKSRARNSNDSNLVFGVGYIGDGAYNYKTKKKGSNIYTTWQFMLMRCYCDKYKKIVVPTMIV